MCESVNPTTIQIWLSGRFSQKGHPWRCQFRPSTITLQPLRGWDHKWCRRDQRLPPPQLPLPSPDHGFKSDRSSVLTALSMSSLSDRLEGSQHSWHGRQCRVTETHMKINLPIFKDEDAKDAVTYQSWRWGLLVYHHAGCRDHTPSCMASGPDKVILEN